MSTVKTTIKSIFKTEASLTTLREKLKGLLAPNGKPLLSACEEAAEEVASLYKCEARRSASKKTHKSDALAWTFSTKEDGRNVAACMFWSRNVKELFKKGGTGKGGKTLSPVEFICLKIDKLESEEQLQVHDYLTGILS
jgi:hypothetical protein